MRYLILHLLMMLPVTVIAQKAMLDLASYTQPRGWNKKPGEYGVQFTRQDAATGTYCMITLYKSMPAIGDAKKNFDASWETLVKETLKVASEAEMQPAINDDGWEVQSGYSTFENEGNKDIVMLVTSSGFEKMVSILILTNTAAYEKDITSFLESISLKKPVTKPQERNPVTPPKTVEKKTNHGFTFTTTNFDNGWTSTAQEDWVMVTKGNIKVLLHYPNKKADVYNSVLLDGLKNAWDVLVAPRYSSASNMQFKPITGWESIEYAEATITEKATGNTVYVVLFKKNYSNGSGKYIEFITPDKNTFEKEFGAYHQESYGWEKMEVMASYNKFAVAVSDLKGKWSNDFSGALQYVNVYTGSSAGMSTHASAEQFVFGQGTTYKWDLGVASGFVGNIKFQSVKSSGRFSMPGNWELTFSDIEGKPRTYKVSFSCVKGARLLYLDDRSFIRIQ